MCLACAGLLAVPAAAGAQQKQKPGANQKQNSIKCRVLGDNVDQASKVVAGNKQAVAKAKSTVRKRKRAYNKAKSKGKKAKAKARKRLRKAKRSLKARNTDLADARQSLKNHQDRAARAGC
jgi:malonyl CoA-acyl carrier protein transacylase